MKHLTWLYNAVSNMKKNTELSFRYYYHYYGHDNIAYKILYMTIK